MDNPTTLLVAIMYVTLIATGLSNLLMIISELVSGKKTVVQPSRTHAFWLIILLFSYFSFFWQTTHLLEFDGWDYIGFIAFLTGPIFLLFGTNLIINLPDSTETRDEFYMEQSTRFFILLIGVQLWVIALDVIFESVGAATAMTGLLAVVFAILAVSKSQKLHSFAAALCALLVIGGMLAEAFLGAAV